MGMAIDVHSILELELLGDDCRTFPLQEIRLDLPTLLVCTNLASIEAGHCGGVLDNPSKPIYDSVTVFLYSSFLRNWGCP